MNSCVKTPEELFLVPGEYGKRILKTALSVRFEENWDQDQRSVIEAGPQCRLLVEAGPGTGKTAVACARLAHLITREGISATNVWMISFTRTAVAEIRARLQSYLGEDAHSVKVATVDAHAWAIHSGFDPAASLTGSYESNIERVIRMISDEDDVADMLSQVEHLVVDEAQDLIGRRADLVLALIRGLSPDCGVTVFADSAQAIYGFSEDDDAAADAGVSTLAERLGKSEPGFEPKELTQIHRTSSPGLKQIFGKVRKSVLDGSRAPAGLFDMTRESVAEHADKSDVNGTALDLDTIPAGSLVLFRSRAETLRHSQFCKRPHSLRLSGYGAHLPAWLALCFSGYAEPAMTYDAFAALWGERVEGRVPASAGPLEAWNVLIRLAGNRDGSLDPAQLRRRLSRGRPPADIATAEFGLPGPILGTIHASKGREADHVTLLMPRSRDFTSPLLEAEETRILFVGATRARRTLSVGNAARFAGSKLDTGRAFRALPGKPSVMVEIGCNSDVSAEGLASGSLLTEAEFLNAQKILADASGRFSELRLERDEKLDWRYRLIDKATESTLAVLPKAFSDDLRSIGKIAEKGNAGGRIDFVRSFGCQTLVTDPDDPLSARLLPAALKSGFILAPMVAAFTAVRFWS